MLFLVGHPLKNKAFREAVQSPPTGCEIETAWRAILCSFLRRLLLLLALRTFKSSPPPRTPKGCELFMLERRSSTEFDATARFTRNAPTQNFSTQTKDSSNLVYSVFWRTYLGESRPLWGFNSELSLWNWKPNWKRCVCLSLFDVSSRSRQTITAPTHFLSSCNHAKLTYDTRITAETLRLLRPLGRYGTGSAAISQMICLLEKQRRPNGRLKGPVCSHTGSQDWV